MVPDDVDTLACMLNSCIKLIEGSGPLHAQSTNHADSAEWH